MQFTLLKGSEKDKITTRTDALNMKHLLFFLGTFLISGLAYNTSFAQEEEITGDYDIKFVVHGVKNDQAVLAYYYMDKKYVKDTVVFDGNGVGEIKGEMNLHSGIYLLAFPSLNLRYFELILGEEESFTMMTDTTDFIEEMKVRGSTENALFYDNMRFLIAQGQVSAKLRDQATGLEQESDEFKAIESKLREMDIAVKAKREKLYEDHPDAYYTAVVKAMSDVEMPPNPDPADSAYPYRYFQQHYFDNIDFSDARLTRTPFLLRKVTTFLDEYTIPVPDSINAAAERIIEASKADYDMFQFCLVGIFNKYAKSKIMSHELVYVNLAKKYYLSGEADWVTEEQLNTFKERIIKMEPTLLGKKAPDIVISDLEGRVLRLHETGAGKYTVLVFWNSSCGHCKKEMPKLKEIHQGELTAMANVQVFAISTELETEEWTAFIEEHDLIADGWIHAHDPEGRNPFRYVYNVESTPLVLVLDPNNEILAKRISLEDIGGLIEFDMDSRGATSSEN